MNILAKLTLRFTVIVASILMVFSMLVYVFSATYRKEEFYDRLKIRAETTARLLLTVEEVDKDLLRIIDKNSVPALPEEKIMVFDKRNALIYSSLDEPGEPYPTSLLDEVRRDKTVAFNHEKLEQVGVFYREGQEEIVVVVSAFDRYGRRKMTNLGSVLLAGLTVGIGIIVLAGRLFAGQSLAPLAKMNAEVSSISAGNLNLRIDEGNRKDEIARLAMNFNQMLQRLETAFEMQQSFVSNASHELRTPLAAMRSQLQVTLAKERSDEEYRHVLQSLLDDTEAFSELTTGLLTLALSSVEKQRAHFADFRVDEALFFAQEELAKRQPGYHFQLEYATPPEHEDSLILHGNEQLLTVAFINFMDNACKFSPDRTVFITLGFGEKNVEVRFLDKGFGIPPGEEEKIFTPFYRAANAPNLARGHGIGLSLCQKIVQLHGGKIRLESRLDEGSSFVVTLPVRSFEVV